ncbi:MAG: hydantoinase B/oxoprolinase family protein, partial [Nitrospinota bacterium]
MSIDPITLEVIRNRLDSIAEEMEISLLKSAYSSIIKEGLDASSALFTPEGECIAQATAIPVHLGTLIPAVRQILAVYPPAEMQDGDIYIMNDPYGGGTHLPDIVLVTPILFQGEVIALGCTMAHHQEMGGKTPGSVPTDATEIYQEGLIIPPLPFYRAGKPEESLHRLLRKNVRIPEVVFGDLRAQMAAGQVAKRRIISLLNDYGVPLLREAMAELLDRAEAMTRAKLAAIPDGTYSFFDYLDNDGIDLDRRIKIQATITIQGSDFHVDFRGTSPQVRGPLNAVPSAAYSCVYYVVRAITDPEIPNNSGCYRPITISIPEGCLLNPRHPAPVNARTATMKRTVDVLLGALVRALPEKIPAAASGQLLVMSLGGIDPRTNRSYVTSELGAGGMGARSDRDGVDVVETDVTNCMNIPVEAIELDYPLRILRYRLWQDSGGAGKYRGGLGFEKIFQAVRGSVTISYRGERFFTQPWGLWGGLAAPCSQAKIRRQTGEEETIPSKRVFTLQEGEELHVFVSGGGGYGDPLTRDPHLVWQDVLDGKVSLLRAREDYGVVIQPETLVLDQDATQ